MLGAGNAALMTAEREGRPAVPPVAMSLATSVVGRKVSRYEITGVCEEIGTPKCRLISTRQHRGLVALAQKLGLRHISRVQPITATLGLTPEFLRASGVCCECGLTRQADTTLPRAVPLR
jgi:hypothetical protein